MSNKVRQISRREAEELLVMPGCQKDEELSTILAPALLLPDGRLLVYNTDEEDEDAGGLLWESKQDFVSYCAKPSQSNPTHILEGRLPHGSTFVENIPSLISRLAQELGLTQSQLGIERKDLQEVDRLVRLRYDIDARVEPRMFEMLVAYVGEAIRQATDGTWQLRQATGNPNIWEPWIVCPDGQEYAPFISVWSEFYDHSDVVGNIEGVVPFSL